MNLEVYYYDITIRLVALMALGLLLSGVYLKYLVHANDRMVLKRGKDIYILQLTFWLLFLGNIFDTLLPNNYTGSFMFEMILLATILISFTFLLWKLFSSKQFDIDIFLMTLPLTGLFILALGMV